jgi:hypothetical protein
MQGYISRFCSSVTRPVIVILPFVPVFKDLADTGDEMVLKRLYVMREGQVSVRWEGIGRREPISAIVGGDMSGLMAAE